jgi:hypothetical protein
VPPYEAAYATPAAARKRASAFALEQRMGESMAGDPEARAISSVATTTRKQKRTQRTGSRP